MARNQFQFGKSDQFDRGQFNDLFGSAVQSQLGGLRGERQQLREDRARERANLGALGNRFQTRLSGLSNTLGQSRAVSDAANLQRSQAMESKAASNRAFIEDLFGVGAEAQGDPTAAAALDAASQQSGIDRARALEQTQMERELQQQQSSGQQAIDQAKAAAFNRFLSSQRDIGRQIDQIKRSRPLIAQQIREQLENRGIAMSELDMQREQMGLQRDQFDEGKRQFDESMNLKREQITAGINQEILKNKQSKKQLRLAYGEIAQAILTGSSKDVKMPVTDETGRVTTVTQTVQGKGARNRADAVSQMQTAGIPRNIAIRIARDHFNAQGKELKLAKDKLNATLERIFKVF